jgi:1,4-alpha-glucan branching enzyme
MKKNNVNHNVTLFTEEDIYLFKEGSHYKLYEKMGSHILEINNKKGVYFALWAPNAKDVFVIGDFNKWKGQDYPLKQRGDSSGLWEGFIPWISKGEKYKYLVISKYNNQTFEKSDPYATYSEISPKTASIVWDMAYEWNDQEWIRVRRKYNAFDSQYSIYEVHLNSWRLVDGKRPLTYMELAESLVEYVKDMGFTFVELMPIMEHPFNGSWGYQTTGYFAATSRYGTPQELMYLIDRLHKNGIGVILDWVPSHFPSDGHGLAYFDGTNLYEHADPRKGFHPDWKSYIFNYGRNEVREFLISSALFWFDKFHVDAIRVDGVASMLYLNYSRKDGEWIPNERGGHENFEAIDFLQKLNHAIYSNFSDVNTIAEESSAWPLVTRPVKTGGLGFGMKWNMGWMHDILRYFEKDPIYRKYHHNELTFSLIYAFNENFLLSLSHDEVVYGKKSLLEKMPGDDWQKFANLRLLTGFMYAHPGKKLLFMGSEFAQRAEWNYNSSLDWHLLNYQDHQNMQNWIKTLNDVYRNTSALFESDFEASGFEWIDHNDYEKSIISFLRKSKSSVVLCICNFTPQVYDSYEIGVPLNGNWKIILDSDNKSFGGSAYVKETEFQTDKKIMHNHDNCLTLNVPPLAILILKYEKN